MLLEINWAFVKLYSDLLMRYIIKRIILHSQSVLNFGAASPQSIKKVTAADCYSVKPHLQKNQCWGLPFSVTS